VAKFLPLVIRILVETKRQKIARGVFAGAYGILLQADLCVVIILVQETNSVLDFNVENPNVIHAVRVCDCDEPNVRRRKSIFIFFFLLLIVILVVAVVGRVCIRHCVVLTLRARTRG